MMVLTAKFGCARLYSRIMCADMDSRRLNLQACYAEYQWIIAYAEKFDVRIFQEELALCREMVRARACAACLPLPLPRPASRPPVFSPANRRRSFPRKSLLFRPTAACTLPPAADVAWPPLRPSCKTSHRSLKFPPAAMGLPPSVAADCDGRV